MSQAMQRAWFQQFEYRLLNVKSLPCDAFTGYEFEEADPVTILSLGWNGAMTSTSVTLAVQKTRRARILWELKSNIGEHLALAEIVPSQWPEFDSVGALVLWWLRSQAAQGIDRPDFAAVESTLDVPTLNALVNNVWPREARP